MTAADGRLSSSVSLSAGSCLDSALEKLELDMERAQVSLVEYLVDREAAAADDSKIKSWGCGNKSNPSRFEQDMLELSRALEVYVAEVARDIEDKYWGCADHVEDDLVELVQGDGSKLDAQGTKGASAVPVVGGNRRDLHAVPGEYVDYTKFLDGVEAPKAKLVLLELSSVFDGPDGVKDEDDEDFQTSVEEESDEKEDSELTDSSADENSDACSGSESEAEAKGWWRENLLYRLWSSSHEVELPPTPKKKQVSLKNKSGSSSRVPAQAVEQHSRGTSSFAVEQAQQTIGKLLQQYVGDDACSELKVTPMHDDTEALTVVISKQGVVAGIEKAGMDLVSPTDFHDPMDNLVDLTEEELRQDMRELLQEIIQAATDPSFEPLLIDRALFHVRKCAAEGLDPSCIPARILDALRHGRRSESMVDDGSSRFFDDDGGMTGEELQTKTAPGSFQFCDEVQGHRNCNYLSETRHRHAENDRSSGRTSVETSELQQVRMGSCMQETSTPTPPDAGSEGLEAVEKSDLLHAEQGNTHGIQMSVAQLKKMVTNILEEYADEEASRCIQDQINKQRFIKKEAVSETKDGVSLLLDCAGHGLVSGDLPEGYSRIVHAGEKVPIVMATRHQVELVVDPVDQVAAAVVPKLTPVPAVVEHINNHQENVGSLMLEDAADVVPGKKLEVEVVQHIQKASALVSERTHDIVLLDCTGGGDLISCWEDCSVLGWRGTAWRHGAHAESFAPDYLLTWSHLLPPLPEHNTVQDAAAAELLEKSKLEAVQQELKAVEATVDVEKHSALVGAELEAVEQDDAGCRMLDSSCIPEKNLEGEHIQQRLIETVEAADKHVEDLTLGDVGDHVAVAADVHIPEKKLELQQQQTVKTEEQVVQHQVSDKTLVPAVKTVELGLAQHIPVQHEQIPKTEEHIHVQHRESEVGAVLAALVDDSALLPCVNSESKAAAAAAAEDTGGITKFVEEIERRLPPDRKIALVENEYFVDDEGYLCAGDKSRWLAAYYEEEKRSNLLRELELACNMKRLELKHQQIQLQASSTEIGQQMLDAKRDSLYFRFTEAQDKATIAACSALRQAASDYFLAALFVMTGYTAYCAWNDAPVWYNNLVKHCTDATTDTASSKSWLQIFSWKKEAKAVVSYYVCMAKGASQFGLGSVLSVPLVFICKRMLTCCSSSTPMAFFILGCYLIGAIQRNVVHLTGGDGHRWWCVWMALCSIHACMHIFTSFLVWLLGESRIGKFVFHFFLAAVVPVGAGVLAFPLLVPASLPWL